MRKQSLRQTANRYLQTDNRGSFKDKQHRAFVIHKLIDDLFIIGEVPPSWNGLKPQSIHKLIEHWQKHKMKPATMMDHMTTIREFLTSLHCELAGIDNKSLGLTRQYKRHQKKKIPVNISQQMAKPVPYLIMALQTQFGLTFSEAIYLIPDIHIREHKLWITREIAFNSTDRTIPIRFETQILLISELIHYTQGHQYLAQTHKYEDILSLWRMALMSDGLPVNKTYRYLYAQLIKKELSPILGNYHTNWLILDEMGIKSRNTLWSYLNE
ncbi:MAG: phage integrase N-terminal domain-containing protein [bacterium]|nr:phage integrase N-terminal domain-containing protein [bacterium]